MVSPLKCWRFFKYFVYFLIDFLCFTLLVYLTGILNKSNAPGSQKAAFSSVIPGQVVNVSP